MKYNLKLNKKKATSSGQQILKQCEKEVRESLAAFGLGTRKIRSSKLQAASDKPQASSALKKTQ